MREMREMSRATNRKRSGGIRVRLCGLGTLVLAGVMVSGCASQAIAIASSQATRAAASLDDAAQAAAAIDAFGFDF
jgi:hypothetical protein